MDDLLTRARQEGTPLIDGDQATFLWTGDPGRYDVQLIGDFTRWSWGTPVTLDLAVPGLYKATVRFDPDAYVEYGFKINEERVPDPFNHRFAPTGIGIQNHSFEMPALSAQLDRVWEDRGAPRGRVIENSLNGLITLATPSRRVWLYQPPVEQPVPLLIVFDGEEYLNFVRLPTILDNLIAAGRIQPVALALIENGGTARFSEYMCNDGTLGLLTRALIPLARTHLNLLDPIAHPGSYGLLGASMGGLMALWGGLRLPELFGTVISQSGAFGFDLNGHPAIIWEWLRAMPHRDLRVWMNAGRYEWLAGANQNMFNALAERGYTAHYEPFNAGHNYTAWRYQVGAALEWAYGK